ncbi:Thymidylate synthase [Entomophthora muscae]|uniref:Thymidylate synthase n=1 Tax=Entomophthora muscae TaxID=34485 RepID=A0ACC2SUU4_9FUNG|nr:Thymidylate synthase [Entomophthora muscae]
MMSEIQPSNQENQEEQTYLDLISTVIEEGVVKTDRTGTGTISVFAPNPLKFNLSDNEFPLLTTKRVFIRGVIEELLWFIKGDTNALHLSEKGVHIWDGNGSRDFLDKAGFTDRQVGDLGPVYGFQWRHFGAKYIDCNTDYTGQGVDQLNEVIYKIKNTPDDRRIILSAWNPSDLGKMALPPCHMFCQFYVTPANPSKGQLRGSLSCQMYQRSCDVGLGVPFNIASYALLTIMIAYICDLEPGTFSHCMGDTHIYLNHVDPLKVQITRSPRPFPKLVITPTGPDDVISTIDDFRPEHFVITGYNPYPKIDMVMAV